MEVVQTQHGPVAFWGRLDDPRPKLLAIRGAFAGLTEYNGLPIALNEYNVLLTHLPGMHTPFLAESSVESFARAYDAALPGVDVVGFSVGGLVAMAMRTARRVVAVDPPLDTGALWPLRAFLKTTAANGSSDVKAWIAGVFGTNDYRHLVKPEHTVIIAGEPLEPERDAIMPGLITRQDREWLQTRCRTVTIPSGHNVARCDSGRPLLRAIRDAMPSAAGVP